MNYQKAKIVFYRKRSFSEKMNVTFEFIRENWKPLFKYSFYLVMPICLIQAFATNFFAESYTGLISGGLYSNYISTMSSYGVMMLCQIVGLSITAGLIYAMMQTYSIREDGLASVIMDDFKDSLIRNAWRYLVLVLIIIAAFVLLALIVGVLVAISAWSLLFTIPASIYVVLCLIPLMMTFPVYLFERDITFSAAVRKAWKLSMATLGGMIGLMFVCFIIMSIIQTVTMMPWYLTTVVNSVLAITSESAANQSVLYKFIIYVLGIVQSFGSYIGSIVFIIGLAFQYFHARETVEGVNIESNITKFDEL